MTYCLNSDGSFSIEDYQQARVFANFFPGVAGLYGIPMWAFYVNRGQAISSFGIESKDKAVLEFQPANKAFRLTSIQGFRTFLKVRQGKTQKFYEPFANRLASPYSLTQRMVITSHDLTLEEVNRTLGLTVRVNYFTLPQEPYASLVRRLTITNISKKDLAIDCVDGLPAINPYGLKDWLGKHIGRTVEAWGVVRNLARKAPFYQFKVEVADTPQVTHIKEGNFYFGFELGKTQLLTPVVESACVFGQSSDFLVPERFYGAKTFAVPSKQQSSNRTPCAMVHAPFLLKAGKSRTIASLGGFAHDVKELGSIVKKALKPGFLESKAQRNKAIISEIKDYCCTHSASTAFDQYCGQTFLDNVLRGGLPVSLRTAQGPVSFNVYSRKHGDLERDYNFFTLAPTYLSQGNGNYRDVNQNRRNDIWFNADVGDSAITSFLNLIQADGYNPLVVKGAIFAVADQAVVDAVLKEFGLTGVDGLRTLLIQGFMPGDLLKRLAAQANAKINPQVFLNKVLSVSRKHEYAEFGEGYWSDHWTYNLDLIESYLRLYPENLRALLIEKKDFNFYLSDVYVLPRIQRYILTPNGIRQYHSLAEGDKQVKAKERGYRLRTKQGTGDVYHTSLIVKLLCLLANKAATLDPSGVGIEMEANKPNWFDALNGLPGLLGSSINETFEVKRLVLFLRDAIRQLGLDDAAGLDVFSELADFILGLSKALVVDDPLQYWRTSNDLKEQYRHAVRCGIDGQQGHLNLGEIKHFLNGIIEKMSQGVTNVSNARGLFPSYFYHEVVRYDDHLQPLEFRRHDLPYFLEGFVHGLRVLDTSSAGKLHAAITKSPLFDRSLRMYKVCADLSSAAEEIGRARIFPTGWLENETIWLHMEYKYLLELLRVGCAAEFFEAARTCFVPFMDPARYGRNILENSSFIVSSAHEDKALHGQGFVARLSGSTAEFVHMWLLMNVGLKPFKIDANGQLTLTFSPILPAWLFTTKAVPEFPAHTYAFKFLNSTLVVYHNPKGRDTFGAKGVSTQSMALQYKDSKKIVEVKSATLCGQMALDVRSKKVDRIDAYLS